jgi:hypothetical protein
VTAALLLLLGGLYFTRQLAEERNTARDREAEARKEWERAEEEKERAERQLDLARRNLMTAQLLRVAAVYEKDPYEGRQLLNDPIACPPDLRDLAWRYYNRACQRERFTLKGHAHSGLLSGVYSVAFAADGLTLASASADRTVKLWDVKVGQERHPPRAYRRGPLGGVRGGRAHPRLGER